MEIIFLGTSSAVPSRERNHAAIIIRDFGEVFLFDCGEGTQRQLIDANVSPMKIDKIFITHFHGDHILGLGGLIQSMGLRKREEKLDIYGPKGIKRVMNTICHTGYFKIDFELNVHEVDEGTVLETDQYMINTTKTKHSVPNNAYSIIEKKKPRFLREKAIELGVPVGPDFGKLHNGQEVEIDGRIIKPEQVLGKPRKGIKVTYSGDTRPSSKMIVLAEDSDVLIHEATFEEADREHASEHGHSTAKDAADIAKQANANMLILTHISPRYQKYDILLNEAREVFENTEMAEDFKVFNIVKKSDE
ncbi:MAG: ribonuclease Z [Methanobrevibacter sp.]|nr:ribonuclease Z [Methanobrevibacter sp.]